MGINHENNRKKQMQKRIEKMIFLSMSGYNNSSIAEAYEISRERVRQIFQKNNHKRVNRDQVKMYKSEEIFIKKCAELGINSSEISSLLPRVPILQIQNIAKGYKTITSQERSLIMKKFEILRLAESGFGLVEIAKITKTHKDNVNKLLKENGYDIVTGSGVYKKVAKGK